MIRARCLRLVIAAGLVVYLGLHAWQLGWNIVGDRDWSPAGYFHAWDMFPGSYDTSSRRVALGLTRKGEYVQVYPNPTQQFRGGVSHNLPRADLDRLGLRFRTLVDRAIVWTNSHRPDDPLVEVKLLEQYWPSRLNLEDDLYPAWAGEPKRDVRYWRVTETLKLDKP